MAFGKMSYEYIKTGESADAKPSITSGNSKSAYSQVKLRKDAYEHEERVKDSDHKHELAIQRGKMGLLGRLFGADENSSKNITLIIIVFILAIAILLTYQNPDNKDNSDFAYKIWDKVFPIVTLSLGYIFGKNK